MRDISLKGECRRHAPMAGDRDRKDPYVYANRTFPMTQPADWCGDHEPVEAGNG